MGLGILVALALGELSARLAAHWSPHVAYLATASADQSRRRFETLDEYLASKSAQVIPHRNWFNYWNNALGMNDEEFAVPKPAGRFRIMAVGDSFTYGLVPYPYAVMTLVRSALRRACPGKDLDLLNFGIAGTGVREYRILLTLGLATYDPDLVLVNFFAGNRGADAYRRSRHRPRLEELPHYSYLWTLATSVVRLRLGLAVGGAALQPGGAAPPGAVARGGAIVDPAVPFRPDDPAFVGPFFTETAFTAIQAGELRRLYVPPQRERLEGAWRPVLAELDAIHGLLTEKGRRLVLVLYPSELQVDPAMRETLIATLRKQPQYAALSPQDIDPRLPNTQLTAYCQSRGITCFDLTPAFIAARQRSDEPLYKKRDGHWTIRGNRVAAEAEAAYLAETVCPRD